MGMLRTTITENGRTYHKWTGAFTEYDKRSYDYIHRYGSYYVAPKRGLSTVSMVLSAVKIGQNAYRFIHKKRGVSSSLDNAADVEVEFHSPEDEEKEE